MMIRPRNQRIQDAQEILANYLAEQQSAKGAATLAADEAPPLFETSGLSTEYAKLTTELGALSAEVDLLAGEVSTFSASANSPPYCMLGKITQVVSSDPDYGAHLVVQPQEYKGTPPTASDSVASTVRCFPTPNHVVGDYTVDEYVLMQIVADSDACLAFKFA